MADSLDDFFAKKDKKRGKDKGKAALSTEALVRELEEGSKQLDYPVRKENKTSTVIELLGLDANDADWRDFEDVEKRDYTGLKVKEMSLQDQNEEELRRIASEQSEQAPDQTAWRTKDDQSASTAATYDQPDVAQKTLANEKAPDTSSTTTSAQTNVGSSSSEDKPKLDEVAKSVPVDSESTDKKGDKQSAKPAAYVPPYARMAGEVKLLEPTRLSKIKASATRTGAMPDLQDKQLFPSLG